jgi:hypothetical protein
MFPTMVTVLLIAVAAVLIDAGLVLLRIDRRRRPTRRSDPQSPPEPADLFRDPYEKPR